MGLLIITTEDLSNRLQRKPQPEKLFCIKPTDFDYSSPPKPSIAPPRLLLLFLPRLVPPPPQSLPPPHLELIALWQRERSPLALTTDALRGSSHASEALHAVPLCPAPLTIFTTQFSKPPQHRRWRASGCFACRCCSVASAGHFYSIHVNRALAYLFLQPSSMHRVPA